LIRSLFRGRSRRDHPTHDARPLPTPPRLRRLRHSLLLIERRKEKRARKKNQYTIIQKGEKKGEKEPFFSLFSSSLSSLTFLSVRAIHSQEEGKKKNDRVLSFSKNKR